jgi:hypothetical protein
VRTAASVPKEGSLFSKGFLNLGLVFTFAGDDACSPLEGITTFTLSATRCQFTFSMTDCRWPFFARRLLAGGRQVARHLLRIFPATDGKI